ncbi:hypothetical protein D3C80_1842930 [compost metagenome]
MAGINFIQPRNLGPVRLKRVDRGFPMQIVQQPPRPIEHGVHCNRCRGYRAFGIHSDVCHPEIPAVFAAVNLAEPLLELLSAILISPLDELIP